MVTPAGYYGDFPNASDVALPGETIEADPYGALALIEGTGQTVAPPVAQLVAAGSAPPVAAAPAASLLTNTFTLGGVSIPYWAIGAGLLAAYLFSRSGRRGR